METEMGSEGRAEGPGWLRSAVERMSQWLWPHRQWGALIPALNFRCQFHLAVAALDPYAVYHRVCFPPSVDAPGAATLEWILEAGRREGVAFRPAWAQGGLYSSSGGDAGELTVSTLCIRDGEERDETEYVVNFYFYRKERSRRPRGVPPRPFESELAARLQRAVREQLEAIGATGLTVVPLGGWEAGTASATG